MIRTLDETVFLMAQESSGSLVIPYISAIIAGAVT